MNIKRWTRFVVRNSSRTQNSVLWTANGIDSDLYSRQNPYRVFAPCVWCFFLLLTLPVLAHAQGGTALPYSGAAGELPIQVVVRYLGDRLGHDGRFEYGRLRVDQISQPEAFDDATVKVLIGGMMDDSIKGVRQQFTLHREDNRWQIIRAGRQMFLCRRGINWWTPKACP